MGEPKDDKILKIIGRGLRVKKKTVMCAIYDQTICPQRATEIKLETGWMKKKKVCPG